MTHPDVQPKHEKVLIAVATIRVVMRVTSMEEGETMRSVRLAVHTALARISTAHFQHQSVDIRTVTEIRKSRLPAI
jgi:hypothetical protein